MKATIALTVGLIMAAIAVPLPAAAQAVGDVTLQISASASVTSPADKITVTIPVSASGATMPVARGVNELTIEWLKTALVAQGVEAGAITVPPSPQDSFGPVFPRMAGNATGGANKTARATVQVELHDAAQLKRVTELLEGRNLEASAPVYALRDDSAARAAATAEAIRKARAQADSTAAAMGYRVERMTRVSNYGQAMFDMGDFTTMAQTMFASRGGAGGTVVTQARVWIDFVMRPR